MPKREITIIDDKIEVQTEASTSIQISPPWEFDAEDKPVIHRDELGHFLKGQSGNEGNSSPGQRVSRWFFNALTDLDPKDTDGKMKLQKMFERMYEIATNTDKSHMKEATWAFNALMDRTVGPPIKDKSELDAIAKQGGVQIQILQLPALPASSQPQRVKPVLKPEFDDDGYEKEK